jgi:hypothetical protein
MNIRDIAKERERAQQALSSIATLEKLYAEHPDMELAELLHNITCSANHTDGCGWLYESWEKPGSARLRYQERAQLLIKLCGLRASQIVLRQLNGLPIDGKV